MYTMYNKLQRLYKKPTNISFHRTYRYIKNTESFYQDYHTTPLDSLTGLTTTGDRGGGGIYAVGGGGERGGGGGGGRGGGALDTVSLSRVDRTRLMSVGKMGFYTM